MFHLTIYIRTTSAIPPIWYVLRSGLFISNYRISGNTPTYKEELREES
ncbi:hypothetical protein ES705_02464 [subsurface metagenome]